VIGAIVKLYPSRAIVGLALMTGQAFLYNAIFFTYALVLTKFYGISDSTVPLYLLPFAIGNFFGPLLLGPLFDTWGRKKMIALTYVLSGVLLIITGWLFQQGVLTAVTQTIAWDVIFFFASAGASAAYLTVSEIFPMETRAMAISVFYAFGTVIGGTLGPAIFGRLIEIGSAGAVFVGYVIGAGLMIVAGIVELALGVEAAGRDLEDIAKPLTAQDAEEEGLEEVGGRPAGDVLTEEAAGRTERRLEEGERLGEPVLAPPEAPARPARPPRGAPSRPGRKGPTSGPASARHRDPRGRRTCPTRARAACRPNAATRSTSSSPPSEMPVGAPAVTSSASASTRRHGVRAGSPPPSGRPSPTAASARSAAASTRSDPSASPAPRSRHGPDRPRGRNRPRRPLRTGLRGWWCSRPAAGGAASDSGVRPGRDPAAGSARGPRPAAPSCDVDQRSSGRRPTVRAACRSTQSGENTGRKVVARWITTATPHPSSGQ
jgi:Major Facilitator Superfamily